MLNKDVIIDAPLDEISADKESYLSANKRDYLINRSLIFATIVLGIITAILDSDHIFLLAGIFSFFLGVYQLISCAIGAFRGNKSKKSYGIIAIAYVIFLFLGLPAIMRFDDVVLGFLFSVFIPISMAFYYSRLCYLAYQRAKRTQAIDTSISETKESV